MKTVAIERKPEPAPEDFRRDHLSGTGRPVVLTGAIDRWPAVRKWDFGYFKDSFGTDLALAHGSSQAFAKLVRVGDYIDCLQSPGREVPGIWVETPGGKPLRAAPEPLDAPLYLNRWDAFRNHPELYQDIAPAPAFVPDWTLGLDPAVRQLFEWTSSRDYWSVFVGAAGTVSRLHCDYWNTHAYLAQIRGRKRVWLFSPDDGQHLYDGLADPERPDPERFPAFAHATAHEATLGPGEVLFMPAGWWHQVRALDSSITVSHNFFNDRNVTDHLQGLLGDLPRLSAAFERHPDWRGNQPDPGRRAR